VSAGEPPYLALGLALSFAVYSLVRKVMQAAPLPGSTSEVLLLAPLAVGAILWKGSDGAVLSVQPRVILLLSLSGVVTATPLFLFIRAARLLPLTTIGFVQYLAPSIQFFLAVLVFGEPIDSVRVGGFALIWSGLLIFSIDLLRRARGT
jgi:chloramphenicol-sensitive protein RarD